MEITAISQAYYSHMNWGCQTENRDSLFFRMVSRIDRFQNHKSRPESSGNYSGKLVVSLTILGLKIAPI